MVTSANIRPETAPGPRIFRTLKEVQRRTRASESAVRRWVRLGLVNYKRLPSRKGRGPLRIEVDADGFPVRKDAA